LTIVNVYAIQSLGQTVYKTVPDSMVCITPRQDIFFIQQTFEAKEYKNSFETNSNTIYGLELKNNYLEGVVFEGKKQLSYSKLQTGNCIIEKRYYSDNLNKATTKIKLLKTGFNLVVAIAIAEAAYIGVNYMMR